MRINLIGSLNRSKCLSVWKLLASTEERVFSVSSKWSLGFEIFEFRCGKNFKIVFSEMRSSGRHPHQRKIHMRRVTSRPAPSVRPFPALASCKPYGFTSIERAGKTTFEAVGTQKIAFHRLILKYQYNLSNSPPNLSSSPSLTAYFPHQPTPHRHH
jgi:hypothetical protein